MNTFRRRRRKPATTPPRTRGDVPLRTEQARVTLELRPARAGMYPLQPRQGLCKRAPPRTRGDVPQNPLVKVC